MNTTVLEVKMVRGRRLQVRFTRRGSGCSSWQTIVDQTLRYIVALAAAMGVEVTFLDGDKSLGRSARLELPLRLYLAVKVALERLDTVIHAMAHGRFVIDDHDAVAPLVTKLARAYFPHQPAWNSTLMDA